MITTDPDVWASWVPDPDLFLRWDHLEIWAREWGCEPLGVRIGDVVMPLLRDPLDDLGLSGRCDLRSPYDFCGPRGPNLDPEAFDTVLAELGCVTLFQRCHPFHPPCTGATLHSHNHTVDLTGGMEAVRAAYHPSFRRNLRKSRVTVHNEIDPERFHHVYSATMERVDAPPWYRFSLETLAALLALPGVVQFDAVGPEGHCASLLTLRSGDVRFYHLGGSIRSSDRPNHALFDALNAYAHEEGCHTVHLGGGGPTLQKFKSQIANSRVPYHVVKRVVDPKAYEKACVGWEEGPFPRYLGWRSETQ